jgi:PPK2 family polyphosphate:nucleotide phosphotransferase
VGNRRAERQVVVNYAKKFIVEPDSKVSLKDIDASYTGKFDKKKQTKSELKDYCKDLAEQQYLMYAEGERSLLICLQAMDAGGKDGTVNHVFSHMNPQGCRVVGFKQPSAEEARHDFLWRIHRQAPRRGEVVIFNRSHYEDVLVVRVHDLVPKKVWKKRYTQINQFEKMLADQGTTILKFYLHIDADEQLKRFKSRIDDPTKHWKISESDYKERVYWADYTAAFEEALSRCSTKLAPWYVIPANHKWFRNLAISQIVAETLKSLDMSFPEPTVDITDIRRRYHQAVQKQNGSKKK